MLAHTGGVAARASTSDPTAAYQFNLLGNSDTAISLPVARSKAASGAVAAFFGNIVVAAGSPGWSTDQFVYSPGIQTNTYFVCFRTGLKSGYSYPVIANNTTILTLNLKSDTLAGLGSDDQFDIIPYWTLATVFLGSQGVNISPSPGNRPTEVLLPGIGGTGINLSSSSTYYFWSGSWRQVGQGALSKNDDVLLPDTYFIVRHNIPGDTVLTLQGTVLMSNWLLRLIGSASLAQDNAVALPRAVPVSLSASGLFESGAFNASPRPGNRTDELFVFDNTLREINRSASATYYYWNGAWRRVGTGATDVGGDLVFGPGVGVIIRRSGGTGNAVWLNPPPIFRPLNDSFVNAQVITGASGSIIGSNLNATKEPGEPFHAANDGGSSVWYRWTAASSNQTKLDTLLSDFDTVLAVYVGNNVSSLNLVASNNDATQSSRQSQLSFTSLAGTTYWIAIDGFNGATGNLVLRWNQTSGPPPPANDDFATASVLSGSVGSFSALNANATKEPGEPFHAANDGGHSVWYQWTAPVSNPATFDTFGSSFDTLLAVYTGSRVEALSEVASNNDFDAATKASRLTFTPVAGTTYFIAVDGLNGASGNFVLTWSQAGLGYLPDLTIWDNASTNYAVVTRTFLSTDCAVVEGLVQAGTRQLLLFATETRNLGAIDWWLGNPTNNPAFVYSFCHGHYHFNGFMQYRLLDGSNGQLVTPGLKMGFCLTDSLRWDPSANGTPKYNCSLQGIQKGWADVYSQVTAGQWIDITGVPDGYYTLEMTVNPQGLILESDYSNNTARVPVTIGQPAPANDNFNTAVLLKGTTGTFSGLNTFATKEAGEPFHAGNTGGHSLWFSWTAPNNQAVIIDTLGSSINTLLGVYTGSAVNSLSLVDSNDDIGDVYNDHRSRVIFNPAAGTVYQIAVDGYNGDAGNITLNWNQSPPPANDLFSNAQGIVGGAGTVRGDNLLATKEPGEPDHAGSAGGRSIWYRWVAPASIPTTIDTLGSDFDTVMAVYTGNSLSGLTVIASNDDIGGTPNNLLSQVSFSAIGGTTYRIAVDGYNAKRGYVTLNWNLPAGGGIQEDSVSRKPKHLGPASAETETNPVLSCTAMPTGGFLIRLQGERNQVYSIQFSTNLQNWTFLHNLPTDNAGNGVLVDRSKPAGRASLLDPLCGDPKTDTYTLPKSTDAHMYYRAVLRTIPSQAFAQ